MSIKRIFKAGSSTRAFVFDMAGTTVNDYGLIYKTLYTTIKNFGLNIKNEQELAKWHGSNKYEVLDYYLRCTPTHKNHFTELQPKLHKQLNNNLLVKYSDPKNIHWMDKNLPYLFNHFRENDIKIFLNTGYPIQIQESIIETLNMKEFVDDYISSEEVKCGRPNPSMIYELMKRNNIGYARQLVKFGDTPNDIKEGHNALCTSVGVLSGASDEKVLRDAGAKHVIDSVMDIRIDNLGNPRERFFKRIPQARWMSSTIPSRVSEMF